MALWVDDAKKSWEETTKRGAKSYLEPETIEDEHGTVVRSGIHTYGETVHIFVERKNYKGAFLPGFQEWNPAYRPETAGLKYIDHTVGNVDWGQMNKWIVFYRDVLRFGQIISFDDKDISTEYSALMSKVMTKENGRIKFSINDPEEVKRKSQIEEYIEFYNGAGVQQLALATDDIIKTVRELQSRCVGFLTIPTTYYDDLIERVGPIDEDVESLKELGILVDVD